MKLRITGLVGNFTPFSRTSSLVEHLTSRASEKYDLQTRLMNLADLGPSLGQAQRPDQLDAQAQIAIDTIVNSDVLVVGVPTWQAGYPGMFKHLFDLIDPSALIGKPVILSATGGSARHSLMIEQHLRPLFSYLRCVTLPSAVYATADDFKEDGRFTTQLLQRIDRSVDELQPQIHWLSNHQALAVNPSPAAPRDRQASPATAHS